MEQEKSPFDKFMDDILTKEVRSQRHEPTEQTPQREYRRKYAEHPHNRTKVK